MTEVPKFVFIFYTDKGFKCNVLMLLTKNHIFVGHIGFRNPIWPTKICHRKKCSTLTNWHTSDLDSAHIDRKQQKNIIYVEKQGCV